MFTLRALQAQNLLLLNRSKSKTTADNVQCKQSPSVQQPLAASVLGPETASPPNTIGMVDR